MWSIDRIRCFKTGIFRRDRTLSRGTGSSDICRCHLRLSYFPYSGWQCITESLDVLW